LFHVRELVPEGGDVNVGERGGKAFHEGMLHAGAGPVSEDEKLTSGGRDEGERGDVAEVGDWKVEKFSGGHGDGILAEGENVCGSETKTPYAKSTFGASSGAIWEAIRNLTTGPTWFAA
jgi:hypothetical protein